MDRAKWLEERKTGVGGSEIAAVCGIHPYDTPRRVWMVKKGLLEVPETLPMRYGRFMEPFVAQEFCDYVGIELSALRESDTVRHSHFPFMYATPDRLWDSPDGLAVVELKTVGEFAAVNFGPSWTDEVPDQYLLQVGWQMLMVDAKIGYLAALVGNRDVRVFRFTWTHTMQAIVSRAVEECISFWRDYVEADEPPPLIGHEADERLMREAYPQDDGEIIPAPKEIEALVDDWPALMAEKERIDAELKRRENLVREAIGGKTALVLSDGRQFTNKTDKRQVRSLRKPFKSNAA